MFYGVRFIDMEIEYSEEEIKKIRVENRKYIDLFEKSLKNKKLTEKTIKNHLENIDFYLNEFVADHYQEGFDKAHLYLDDFYYYLLQKCLWATSTEIRGVAASLKKFYKCMCDNNIITKMDLSELTDSIKIGLEYCLEFDKSCY